MKYTSLLLVLIAILAIFAFSNTSISSKPSQKISVQIIDEKTNEILVGVKNGNTYSNFDGVLLVNTNEPLSLELISYEKLNTVVKNDTIIKMSSIK